MIKITKAIVAIAQFCIFTELNINQGGISKKHQQ